MNLDKVNINCLEHGSVVFENMRGKSTIRTDVNYKNDNLSNFCPDLDIKINFDLLALLSFLHAKNITNIKARYSSIAILFINDMFT